MMVSAMRRTDSEKGGVMAVMEGFWEEAALELRPLGLNRVNRGRARGSGKSQCKGPVLGSAFGFKKQRSVCKHR